MCVRACMGCVHSVPGQRGASPATPWGPTKAPWHLAESISRVPEFLFSPRGAPRGGEMEQLGRA